MLDVIVEPVAQVIADVLCYPLTNIALKIRQHCPRRTNPQDHQGRLDQVANIAARQTNVQHALNNFGHDQAEPGQTEQQEQRGQDLRPIGAHVGAQTQ